MILCTFRDFGTPGRYQAAGNMGNVTPAVKSRPVHG
jgi:hypothetical protein